MKKREEEPEAVRTTIFGGRPRGCSDVAVPRGIEVLMKKAAVDEAFREKLLAERGAVAADIGLNLDSAERAILKAIPEQQLAGIIRQTVVPAEQRRVFSGKVAAAMLAVLGVGLALANDAAQAAPGAAGGPGRGAGVASRPDTQTVPGTGPAPSTDLNGGRAVAGTMPATGAPAATAAQHQTVIRVLGPDGQPVAGAVLSIYDGTLQTAAPRARPTPRVADENGAYRWDHPAFADSVQVYVGSHNEEVPDAAQATIRLSPSEMRNVKIARNLAGRLLLADGTAAQGWFIGQSTSGGSMSAGHTPSVWLGYGPEGLLPVNATGTFQLLMISETLVAVSPEGVPLLFYVNPANWPQAGQHVVITLPKTRTVERGLVVDEAGKPVPQAPVHAATFFTEGCNAFMSLGDRGLVAPGEPPPPPPPAALTDATGHFALPVPWGTYITPGSADPGFTMARDANDRLVRKTVPTRQNMAPSPLRQPATPPPAVLHGRVLDPAGNPVAGVEVRAWTLDSAGTTPQWRWTSSAARTDAQGRFDLPDMPAGSRLLVSPDSAGAGGSLPGWTEPVPVTLPTTDIQLKTGGRIRILLPQTLEHPITEAVLENTSLTSGDVNRLVRLSYDASDRSLVAGGAAPGAYALNIATAPELAEIMNQPLTIKAGEETRLDLRNQPLPPAARGASRRVDLKLLEKAQPAGGIQVGIYTERFAPELVDAWIKQWQTGDPAARAAVLPKLKAAGSAATDRLAALKPEEREALRAQLPTTSFFFFEDDDFTKVTVDLSNDQGLVRFAGQAGREYVVCAIAPGRGMALERFTLAAAEDPAITLQATRPLVFHLPPNQQPPRVEDTSAGRIDMRLNIIEPAGVLQHAWTRLLTEGRMGFNRPDLDLRGSGSDEQFDDLPVGATVEVSSYDKRFDGTRTIKIEPGDGPVVINPAPAP